MAEQVRIGSAKDLEAIDKVRDAHVAALNAGDAAGWARQFTDDAVQMPPNAPANAGMAAIRGWTGGLLGQFSVKFALRIDEVRVLDDWAMEMGGYTIGLQPKPGGPAMEDRGKYITIYQRGSGGSWRMARDIWNSDNPPPGR